MLITFSNGERLEGILLSQSATQLKVAIKGWDDAAEFNLFHGVWISDQCEPVRIEMEWERQGTPHLLTEADFLCPPDLAARLIHVLLSGENDPPRELCTWAGWVSEPVFTGHVI